MDKDKECGEPMQQGDSVVLVLVALILGIWGLRSFAKWWTAPPSRGWELKPDPEIPVTEAVALLEQSGYEVMTLRRRVPLVIVVDDEQELESRMVIDHFARKGDKLYIIKLARDGQPLDFSAEGLCKELLGYHLLYEEAEGILYVDSIQGTIRKIQFELEERKELI